MGKVGSSGKGFAALLLLGFLASAGRAQVAVVPPGPWNADPPAPQVVDEGAGAAHRAPTAEVSEAASPTTPVDVLPADVYDPTPHDVAVWGEAGFRGYAIGDQVAPNGLEFKALFSTELDFNFWLCRSERVYFFTDLQFWGQRAAPGVTNPSQGPLDFSKREFDLSAGAAWNYYGAFEARAFAYSFNNLNRGDSTSHPSGYADGFGLENRYYLNDVYAALGTEAFDEARATFVSAGFYPTKDMVDSQGLDFKPGPFARASLTLDLLGERLYLYGDGQFIGTRSFTPKLLKLDAGLAARPWQTVPRVEFRLGTNEMFDLQSHDLENSLYGAVRIVF